ncbi:hypothetical protein N7468_010119 [Penicillium chermesinum]|uniref:Piwi domain-containing protein n=1 Tax=Penicillium chermesinum TaxID=63820 RepID=A0A9W9NC29_9EURO|nr:uncharacterized protein N7468_010119 [Penicillium chermesinum]KAJ5217111.1 hypothetical protein N7468_010119 [Penicillium chermesinum]
MSAHRGGGSERGRGYGDDRPHQGSQRGRGPPQSRGPPSTDASVMFMERPQAPANVINLEDQAVKHNATLKTQPNAIERRPDYGTVGQPIHLRANFFNMELNKSIKFYCYRVDIEPTPKIPRLMKDIHLELLKEDRMVKSHAMTDFMHEIFTVKEIDMTHVMVDIDKDKKKKSGRSNADHVFKCAFKLVAVIDHTKILASLRQPSSKYPIEQENILIRALNIMMSAYPFTDRENVKTIGKGATKFFRIDDRRNNFAPLTGGLECGRGFFSSVRLAAGNILLNLNVCHNSMFLSGAFKACTDDFVRVFGEDRPGFNKFVRGVRVELTHLPKEMIDGKMRYPQKHVWGLANPTDGDPQKKEGNPRVKRLGSSPENVQFFEVDRSDASGKKGKYVSVAEYFGRKYNMRRLATVPVLNVGSNLKPQYVPQDVAVILPGQPYGGELATSQRQQIIRFSCRRPPDNFKSIMEDGRKIVGIINDQTIPYGMRMAKDMVVVPGRILQAPTLLYKGKTMQPRDGSWNLRGEKFNRGATFNGRWGYFTLHDENARLFPNVQPYLDAFTNKLKELGLQMPRPDQYRTIPIRRGYWRLDIESFVQNAQKNGYKFAVLILNGLDDKAFNFLKWKADSGYGLLNHCCRSDKFHGKPQPDHQYMANNAMKVNLKLGGTCQTLQNVPKVLANGKTMVVGLDVTHPPPGAAASHPSLGAIVANTNKDLGQWPGAVEANPSRVENMAKLLHSLMGGRLQRWRKENNALPENIIIFRDGVSEGQYDHILNQELPEIRNAIRENYGDQQLPRISLILVTKRHHVRFYPTRQSDCDRTNNPKNGAIVDRVVTRPALWDFYLQAQAPLQGSARPAHYIVMWDNVFTNKLANTTGRPSDTLQELTHHICYVMGRCTRSISYCTPAFLADRLCDRAGKFASAFNLQEREDPPWYSERITR